MAATWSSEASPAVAASPITPPDGRCPVMNPALIPSLLSTASRYSGVEVHCPQGTADASVSRGIPFDAGNMRMRYSASRVSFDSGAMVKPQLPPNAVVTPCKGEGVDSPVPEHLRVEVRVDIDEPGRHHLAGGVDLGRGLTHLPDGDDAIALDAHVGPSSRRRAPVPSMTTPPQSPDQAFERPPSTEETRRESGRTCSGSG